MRLLRQKIRTQPEWVLLLIAVTLVRAVVPHGFMPSMNGATITMSMCGIGSPAAIDVRLPPSPAPSTPDKSHDCSCPCASTVVLAPPPALAQQLAVALFSSHAPVPAPVLAGTPSLHRPQSPRAPPVVST